MIWNTDPDYWFEIFINAQRVTRLFFSRALYAYSRINMEKFTQDVDPTYGGDRLQFFDVQKPLTLSITDFENKWREVDNVWVQFGGTKQLKKDPHGWTKTYDCRFRKRRDSSTKNSEGAVKKRRKTSHRETKLCEAQITITLQKGTVTIRKTHTDGPDHTHDLKACDLLKAPSAVVNFVEDEVKKGYRAPAVKDATIEEFKDKQLGIEYIRLKNVLNIQHKIRGGLDAPFIGDIELEKDLKESMEWIQLNGY